MRTLRPGHTRQVGTQLVIWPAYESGPVPGGSPRWVGHFAAGPLQPPSGLPRPRKWGDPGRAGELSEPLLRGFLRIKVN